MPQEAPEVIPTANPLLVLRRFVPGDRDWRLMARWLSDPRVLDWYEGRDKPYDDDKAAAEWSAEEIAIQGLDCRIMEFDGRPIGYLQFYEADPEEYELDPAETNTWALDLFIGEPDLWEQGLGTTIVGATVDYLFAGAGAAKVIIDPRVENPRAVRTYEKAGFRKVKVLKEHEEHEGAMRDSWLMEVLPERENDAGRASGEISRQPHPG